MGKWGIGWDLEYSPFFRSLFTGRAGHIPDVPLIKAYLLSWYRMGDFVLDACYVYQTSRDLNSTLSRQRGSNILQMIRLRSVHMNAVHIDKRHCLTATKPMLIIADALLDNIGIPARESIEAA